MQNSILILLISSEEEDMETSIDNALSYSSYIKCTEEEWSSNNETTW